MSVRFPGAAREPCERSLNIKTYLKDDQWPVTMREFIKEEKEGKPRPPRSRLSAFVPRCSVPWNSEHRSAATREQVRSSEVPQTPFKGGCKIFFYWFNLFASEKSTGGRSGDSESTKASGRRANSGSPRIFQPIQVRSPTSSFRICPALCHGFIYPPPTTRSQIWNEICTEAPNIPTISFQIPRCPRGTDKSCNSNDRRATVSWYIDENRRGTERAPGGTVAGSYICIYIDIYQLIH